MSSEPSIFVESAKFSAAIGLINEADNEKFPKIISRIAENVHDPKKSAFSIEEKQKLAQLYGLEDKDMQLILNTVEYIFQQTAYYGLKLSILQQNLINSNLSEDKTNIICKAWKLYGKEIIEKLRGHSLAPKHLEDISWNINLRLSQSSKARIKEPNSMIQFGIKDEDTNEIENIILEFNHEQLLGFYKNLEQIQNQLDSLS